MDTLGEPSPSAIAPVTKDDASSSTKPSQPNEGRVKTGIVPPSDKEKANEEDDFIPTAEFPPGIPLPPLVEVGRSHEGEDLVYEARAKIYCFGTNKKSWKERGLGQIKILRHSEIKKGRIVMWRDNINTVACNHSLRSISGLQYHRNSEKELLWSALDFTFEYPKNEIFVCKFINAEDCKEFKEHVDDLLSFINSQEPEDDDLGVTISELLSPLSLVPSDSDESSYDSANDEEEAIPDKAPAVQQE